MNLNIFKAKNDELTMEINGVLLYSKYKPREEALRWVLNNIDRSAEGYLFIGLGLGYHLEYLSENTDKPIFALYTTANEYNLFLNNISDSWVCPENIEFISNLEGIDLKNFQILIPLSYIKAIGENHSLYEYLNTIKIQQISYKAQEKLLTSNFLYNRNNYKAKKYPQRTANIAFLVSSGPSLNTTINWIKKFSKKADIYVVGSALKLLMNQGIIPKATIITDAQPNIQHQIIDSNYKGNLYYLVTASKEAVANFEGEKYMLCQVGYSKAEGLALELNLPTLETGGSVATTAFSLIEYLGYEKLVLFGQDLGFEGQSTHAEGSTSGKNVTTNLRVKANDGTMINTQPNLQVYHRWFNEACQQTSMQVYNTAQKGAAITNVPLITEEQFKGL